MKHFKKMHEQYSVRNYFTPLGMQEIIVNWKFKKKSEKKTHGPNFQQI